MLPFNAFWDASRLDPDGEIDLSYSDDMGRNWVKGTVAGRLSPPTWPRLAKPATSRISNGSP